MTFAPFYGSKVLTYCVKLNLSENFLGEEIVNGLGGNGEELIVNGYANALLALAHAEGTAKINLVTEILFGDQTLQLLYYLTRALDVAGTSDTNYDFKHFMFYLFSIYFTEAREDLSRPAFFDFIY